MLAVFVYLVGSSTTFALRIPPYAAKALGCDAPAAVRVSREDLTGRIATDRDGHLVLLDRRPPGRVAGDSVDFTLTARDDPGSPRT